MPFFQDQEPKKTTPPIKPTEPSCRVDERKGGTYRGAIVNTRHEAIQSLLTYAEGSVWTVDYFRQLLGRDDEALTHQQNLVAPYQQYERVLKYPLRVTEPLSSDMDETTGEFNLTGQAIITVAIVPNNGDLFIADVGDGQPGAFTIEKVTRKSILKTSVYQISYRMTGYLDDELSTDLKDKVVRELTYSENHLDSTDGPLITTGEQTRYLKLKHLLGELSAVWHERFLDKQTNAYLRPGNKRCYDPYLSQAMQRVLEMGNGSATVFTDFLNDPIVDSTTVWKWLLAGEKTMSFNTVTRTITCTTTRWYRELLFSGITMTDIAEIVFPDRSIKLPVELNDKGTNLSAVGNYVFTPAFYDGDLENCSSLERMVWKHLKHEPLNSTELLQHYESVCTWNDLHFFYHVPVLIILIRGFLRRRL